MYAIISSPGSCHFDYYGPATKAECEKWIENRCRQIEKHIQLSNVFPLRIITNREAKSWRWTYGGGRIIK